jgi:hypothetical protein
METDSLNQQQSEPRQYTRKEIGQMRRRYVTIVNSTVKACGHPVKFDQTTQPHNNCIECWSAYFLTAIDLEGVHVVLTKQGVRALIAQRGAKFVKMFRGFLNSRLMPMLNAEAAKQGAVTIEGGTIGNKDGKIQDSSSSIQGV